MGKKADQSATTPKITPAMEQFHRFKKLHPDCVLFFRMGDFYEMFYEDAKLAHRVLGVTLTQRTEGVPMAGVPYHAVENYLRRMIEAGHRVAICDQVEDPKHAKGVVKRDVTRVMTPGTLTDESLLEDGTTAPLAAVMFLDADSTNGDGAAGVAWADLSTGSFQIATFKVSELADELSRIGPRELLYVETANAQPPQRVQVLLTALSCVGTARPGWQFRMDEALETLSKQFQVTTLSGFGIEENDPAIGPASGIVHYLLETQKAEQGLGDVQGPAIARIAHLQPPRPYQRHEHLVIDQTSLRSLEILQTMRSGEVAGSLLSTLQSCRTAMGKRLLRNWLCYPLRSREAIEQRQRAVGAMVEDTRFCDKLRDVLEDVQDVERIMTRISLGRPTPRDIVALGKSCVQADTLHELLDQRPAFAAHYTALTQTRTTLCELGKTIATACIDSPPGHLRDGGLIADGYDRQLDEYRALQRDSNTWLANYQKTLIEKTGVTSLKVGYNKVFGYYIELSAANRDKAPDEWSRKQTLKNAERYITPELKDFEGKVLSARDRAINREQDLFMQLCKAAAEQMQPLRTLAETAAQLDVLACFARRATKYRYVQPTMVDEPILQIEGGRHPVLDELLGDQFVPNDVLLGDAGSLSTDEAASLPHHTLALITGPNMAGKSTYIRQTALIALLAHTGSFVPADRATVGLCDRIFTRIGASDELHTGQSTFMVEMTETANICHHATDRSLVILDEIGRGTSTLDGLSLAWAIAEFLAQKRCRTLFATHYHEITQLAEQYDNVGNLNVTVREWQDEIVFLHRIALGRTDRSFGVHVAKIAGLPRQIVARANELLSQLEVSQNTATLGTTEAGQTSATRGEKQASAASAEPSPQLSLFREFIEHPAIAQLREIDLNQLTPMAAFDLLRRLRDELDGN